MNIFDGISAPKRPQDMTDAELAEAVRKAEREADGSRRQLLHLRARALRSEVVRRAALAKVRP